MSICLTSLNPIMNSQDLYPYIESFVDLIIDDEIGRNIAATLSAEEHKLSVYYLTKTGKMRLCNDPKSFAPKGYSINETNSSIRIYIPIPDDGEEYSYVFLSVDNKFPHEIKAKYKISPQNESNSQLLLTDNIKRNKIWWDNKLIWDSESDDSIINEIIKIKL